MSNNAHAAASSAPESNPPPPAVLPKTALAPATKRRPGELNQRQLAEIEKLEALLPVCREAGAVGPLAEREVTEAFLVAAEGRLKVARESSVSAANVTVAGIVATDVVAKAKKRLLHCLRTFQAAARLKWQQSEPMKLGRYLIGQRIGQSRPLLEQNAQIIIANGREDHLPAISEDMILEAEAKLKAYKESPIPQRSEKAEASGVRVARDEQVAEIIADRQHIQLAAESAWPARNPANACWRLKFRLPEKRAYLG